jgi:hypothetical protein
MGTAVCRILVKILNLKRSVPVLRGVLPSADNLFIGLPLSLLLIAAYRLLPFEGIEMPHDKIEQMSGNYHVRRTKETPFDHCCHETAGMKRADETIEKMTGGKL